MGDGQVNVGATSSNITLGVSVAQGNGTQIGDVIDTNNTNEKTINLTGCGINEGRDSTEYSKGIAEGSNDNSTWNTILQTDSDNFKIFGGSGQNKTGTTSYRYIRARTSAKGGGSRVMACVTAALVR